IIREMKLLVVFALCVAVTNAGLVFQDEWEEWKTLYGKSYEPAEEAKRQYIWLENLKYVTQHNLEADEGKHTYRVDTNKYADLSNDEWRELISSQVTRPANQMSFCNMTYSTSNDRVIAPTSVDWRKKGFVTPVKDQKQCGSCWAFSTELNTKVNNLENLLLSFSFSRPCLFFFLMVYQTGSLEGQHFKKTGKLVSLSEQNLVDCSTKDGNHGCNGGLMDLAFKYIFENGGIDTEMSYPYMAKNEPSCSYKRKSSGATLTGCVDIMRGNEMALMKAVAEVGPISVAIDAGHKSFQMYKSGVYYEPDCSSVKLDHGVLAVGFGTEDGKDFWLVKNSWGPVWGMEGYIMMSRNKSNNCGIAT
uniref:Cathepsin L.1 n=1 Tax=Ciona savignyi TaxID=51511 RepID=H2ZK40_CIOSA